MMYYNGFYIFPSAVLSSLRRSKHPFFAFLRGLGRGLQMDLYFFLLLYLYIEMPTAYHGPVDPHIEIDVLSLPA